MTDTRTTSTFLVTTTDGSFLTSEFGDGDRFESTLETSETDTKAAQTKTSDEPVKTTDESDTTLVLADEPTVAEFEPITFDNEITAEDDGGTILSSTEEFNFGDGDTSNGSLAAGQYTNIYGDESANTLEGGNIVNYIYGYGGADILIGNGGDDHLYGGNGDDEVYGGTGQDYLRGGAGNDDIFGGSGNDVIRGGEGNDTIYGGDGNDVLLYGGEGIDNLFGGAGDDTFSDNTGDDTYTGGEGADEFHFYFAIINAEPGGGKDLIEDFELGIDTLEIANLSPEYYDLSFNDYIDQYASGGGDAGVVIEWENGLIRLAGIDKADLNPWDVVFI